MTQHFFDGLQWPQDLNSSAIDGSPEKVYVVCLCMCVCVHVRSINSLICKNVYVSRRVGVYVCMSACACVCTCVYVCMYVRVRVSACVCMGRYVHVRM